jgi:hypothetical protein
MLQRLSNAVLRAPSAFFLIGRVRGKLEMLARRAAFDNTKILGIRKNFQRASSMLFRIRCQIVKMWEKKARAAHSNAGRCAIVVEW